MDTIIYGIVAIVILIILIRAFEVSGALIKRVALENDRLESENEARDAATAYKKSQAAKLLDIAPHFKAIYTGDKFDIDGKLHHYIPVYVPPAPVTLNTGEVVSADELKLRRAAMQLVEASIAEYSQGGNQIAPANSIDGQLGVKWQDVIGYLATNGWVLTKERIGTFCTGSTPNLAALRLAVAAKALPQRA